MTILPNLSSSQRTATVALALATGLAMGGLALPTLVVGDAPELSTGRSSRAGGEAAGTPRPEAPAAAPAAGAPAAPSGTAASDAPATGVSPLAAGPVGAPVAAPAASPAAAAASPAPEPAPARTPDPAPAVEWPVVGSHATWRIEQSSSGDGERLAADATFTARYASDGWSVACDGLATHTDAEGAATESPRGGPVAGGGLLAAPTGVTKGDEVALPGFDARDGCTFTADASFVVVTGRESRTLTIDGEAREVRVIVGSAVDEGGPGGATRAVWDAETGLLYEVTYEGYGGGYAATLMSTDASPTRPSKT